MTAEYAASPQGALEARTMRRVALRIVPFLVVCYFISFVDRVNLGFAALQMVRDLRMSATAFGLGGGLFFVSYFLCEVPSNLLLEKLGARRWIARITITWGFLAAGMALIRGAHSFYALRLLLGAAEAGFFPGVILYLTYWFPADYRARIIAIFTVAIPFSSFLGSPISAALLGFNGWLGLRGWQWMFILEGAPAVLVGLACLVVLTDRPAGAKWLDDDERNWLVKRLAAETRAERLAPRQSLWQVLWNKDVLGLSLALAGSTAVSSGLQLWQPQIIQSYGLTNLQTGLLNSIPFALASAIMIWWGRRSDQSGERIWHASLPLILTAFSLAAAMVFDSLLSTLVILCLAVIGIYAGKGPVWAMATEALSASTAAAGLAQINALSNLAGFGTTYVMGFIKDATGKFSLALLPLVVLAGAAALAIHLVGRTGVGRRGTRGTAAST
ncbi:MAG TPA: MFS transporter [Candidatus Sulfopaludibacter sp.]|nr:MFS transporter [Candidatus Sulfopaludibacter sp.]